VDKKAYFKVASKELKRKKVGQVGISLYEHNRRAYEAAVSLMRETGRAAVIHPTGTGKSFIGFKLCEENPESRVCWLSPSEYIFKTQLENLKAVSGGYEPENIQFLTYAKLMLMEEEDIRGMNISSLMSSTAAERLVGEMERQDCLKPAPMRRY
jgi:superfamily II DNA or RNA helicase